LHSRQTPNLQRASREAASASSREPSRLDMAKTVSSPCRVPSASAARSVDTKISAPMGARKPEGEKRDIQNKRLPGQNLFNN
jgi:hypothetical protein